MVKINLRYVIGIKKGSRTLYYWHRKPNKLVRLPDDPACEHFVAMVNQLNAAADSARQPKESEIHPHGSFNHLVASYKESNEYSSLAIKTQKGYTTCFNIMQPKLGHLQIRSMPREFVMKYRDKLIKEKGEYTSNAVIRVLRLLMNWALDRGMIDKNPAERPRLARVAARQNVWTEEAETTFLTKAAEINPMMGLAYTLAVYSTQRQGDLLRRKWSQYDGKRIILKQNKTSKHVVVPYHPALMDALNKAKKTANSEFILADESGNPFKSRYFAECWAEITKAANIEYLQFRDLRRTSMVRFAEAGANAIEITSISGHEIDTAQDILETYIPRNQEMGKSAMNKREAHEKSKRQANNKSKRSKGKPKKNEAHH